MGRLPSDIAAADSCSTVRSRNQYEFTFQYPSSLTASENDLDAGWFPSLGPRVAGQQVMANDKVAFSRLETDWRNRQTSVVTRWKIRLAGLHMRHADRHGGLAAVAGI